MKPDLEKIDDAVLALLHLTSFTEGKGELTLTRAWKALDRVWAARQRSPYRVVLSKEGRQRSEELFRRLFCG